MNQIPTQNSPNTISITLDWGPNDTPNYIVSRVVSLLSPLVDIYRAWWDKNWAVERFIETAQSHLQWLNQKDAEILTKIVQKMVEKIQGIE